MFFNEQLTKEEYDKKLIEINLGSNEALRAASKKAHACWLLFPSKYIHGRQNANASGDYIYKSKNTKKCFRVRECESVKFCQNILGGPVKDCYDYASWGENAELLYECLICGKGDSKLRFCLQCYPNNQNLEYCVFCQKSSDLFGCIGLKNKQYCIFNKQYTKAEYEALVPKLKKHMTDMPYRDKAGNVFGYGEFFPPELSPFPYHITEANEFFPLTETKALKEGFLWYPLKKDEYISTLSTSGIPDHISKVSDTIINEVLACEHDGICSQECTKAFKVIKEELDFCRHLGIPIPRLCPNCRHYERLLYRNPAQLWHRACMCEKVGHNHDGRCPIEFETSYAPERKEMVYCESCYNSEVV